MKLSEYGRTPGAWVYAIVCEADAVVKFGVASNCSARLASLQSSSHQLFRILVARKFDDKPTAHDYEKIIHTRCDSAWIRGEWFYLNDHQVKVCIRFLKMPGV
jgi:hypothetical protein